MRRPVALLVLSVIAACGGREKLPPLGQVLLTMETDAPLPPPAGEPLGPMDPLPIFDRLRIDIHRPHEAEPCADCTHEFDVDRRLVAEGRASVGFFPPVGQTGYVARLRLYRSTFVERGEPAPDATIDMTVALPPIAEEGIVPVTVMMRTDDVAKKLGTLDAPLPAPIGAPKKNQPGTWAQGVRRDCVLPRRDGEVCIPGGAYWMSNWRTWSSELAANARSARLVALAPFFLDATEVKVKAFRDAGVAERNDPFPGDDPRLPFMRLLCTYSSLPGYNEDVPVNCLSFDRAAAYCAELGAELPSEAQLQYVASAFVGRRAVWGEDTPKCEDATFARLPVVGGDSRCPGIGVAPSGSGARDRLELSTGTIVDLVGNLAEYTRDVWNLPREGCWGSGVFVDPVCDEDRATPHAVMQHTVAGGSWVKSADAVTASSRAPSQSYEKDVLDAPLESLTVIPFLGTGFRCARRAL